MGDRSRRIRAMRVEEPAAQIAARAAALRPFIGRTEAERIAALSRLLRQERRAAAQGAGYDACRHAALNRLLTESRSKMNAPNENGPRG